MTAPIPPSAPARRPSWFGRMTAPAYSAFSGGLELLAGALSLAGIPVAMILGKLFLAAILASLVLGIGLRFARRRRLPGRARTQASPDFQK